MFSEEPKPEEESIVGSIYVESRGGIFVVRELGLRSKDTPAELARMNPEIRRVCKTNTLAEQSACLATTWSRG
jgi:hypothetical protein